MSTFYRVNIVVAIPKTKQDELLAVVQEKKKVNTLQAYFSHHFGKVMDRSLMEVKNNGAAKGMNGNVIKCDLDETSGDFFYNYGLQGPYDDLIRFMENSYVQSSLKFLSPFSKSKTHHPYDKDKKPKGDFFIHIGEDGYNAKLPQAQAHGLTKAPMKSFGKVSASASAQGQGHAPVQTTGGASTKSYSAAAKIRAPPAPLCPLGQVSQSLTYKMREAKKVEQDYETAEKDIKALEKKLKELGLKRTTLKTEIGDLKKELKKLMEEETEEESDDESSDEDTDDESDEE